MPRGDTCKKNIKRMLNHAGDTNTMEDVFGDAPLDPFRAQKIYWDYMRTGIAKRGKV